MPTATDLYLPRHPGDLVTAEDWNDLQKKIQEDIDAKVKKGVEEKTTIQNADNAGKLENKTPDQLAREIVDKALAELTKVTGYRNYFKLLKVGQDSVLKHGLRAFPLVDIYQLDYFPVINSEDEQKTSTWVNYYLYHSSEKTLRLSAGPGPAGTSAPVEIQPTKEPYFRIPFSEMLSRYNVQFDENSTLDDLETEFWEAFFKEPNDAFHDDQYGHSPWFDRCCGDRRTVAALKRAGNWDEIWFKMLPRKTINYGDFGVRSVFDHARPVESVSPSPPVEKIIRTAANQLPSPAPTKIQVVHYDFDTLGLKLLEEAVPQVVPDDGTTFPAGQLKVMVLLNAGAGIKIEKPHCG